MIQLTEIHVLNIKQAQPVSAVHQPAGDSGVCYEMFRLHLFPLEAAEVQSPWKRSEELLDL